MTAASTAAVVLLRVARRRSAWERSASEIIETEFQDGGEIDLRPSVYKVEDSPAAITRVVAEHSAGAGLDPPRGALCFDTAGATPAPAVPTPGEVPFAFARDAHHEIRLSDPAQLRTLVEALLRETDRRREVTKASLHEYVAASFAAADPEWTAFAASSEKAAGWAKLKARKTQ